jgi:hypothetical protein
MKFEGEQLRWWHLETSAAPKIVPVQGRGGSIFITGENLSNATFMASAKDQKAELQIIAKGKVITCFYCNLFVKISKS